MRLHRGLRNLSKRAARRARALLIAAALAVLVLAAFSGRLDGGSQAGTHGPPRERHAAPALRPEASQSGGRLSFRGDPPVVAPLEAPADLDAPPPAGGVASSAQAVVEQSSQQPHGAPDHTAAQRSRPSHGHGGSREQAEEQPAQLTVADPGPTKPPSPREVGTAGPDEPSAPSETPPAEPLPPPAPPTVTCDDAERVCIHNEDGEWVVWKAIDPTGSRPVGAIVAFTPADRTDGSKLIDDGGAPGVINDPRLGGAGAFGWQAARRPESHPVPIVDANGDISADHAWAIDTRQDKTADGLGVTAAWVHQPPVLRDPSTLAFGMTVQLADLFADVFRVTYDYEFYNGPAADPFTGGVRVWITITSLCADGRCGSTDMTAFLKEPKVVASLAPTSSGALEYPHVSVLDSAGALLAQCNLDGLDQADGTDPNRPDSCQVPRTALQAGAAQVRFDDGPGGCDPLHHQCFSASFRAYPTGAGPATVPTLPWATPGAGLWGWADAAWTRACLAPPLGLSGCTPEPTDSADGCLLNSDAGPLGGGPAMVTRWELHQKDGAEQVLVPAWEGGFGAYDCPIASRGYGDADSWSLYLNLSYGSDIDLAELAG